MSSDRDKRREIHCICQAESLECRRLLSATIAATLANVSVAPSASATSIDLSGYFTDPAIASGDTTVLVKTTNGDIPLELFNSVTPNTVTNFLQYVNGDLYNGVIFHRTVPNFIDQTGGFNTAGQAINNLGTVANEFHLSNTAGTIAMAKMTGDTNSASNQWFINVGDNASILDGQNGGFTVFGKVLYNGMTVATTINSLPTIDGSALNGQFGPENGANVFPVQSASAGVAASNRPEEGDELTYVHQTGDTLNGSDGGDQYTGLDRFGRVVDQWWLDPSTSTTISRFQYGYDDDGNVVYKNDLVTSSNSELYSYDDLNRLSSYEVGTLNSGHTAITGTPSDTWSATLDGVGDRNSVTVNGTETDSTFNSQNEQTGYGSATLAYDNAGDMTTDQNGNTLNYDAWGRLRADTVDPYTDYFYDALGRRISSDGTEQLIYDQNGQVLEDRHITTSGSSVTVNTLEDNVWGPSYVNQLVLQDHYDASTETTTRTYAMQDANYNVVVITNASGTVVDRFAYDQDGNIRSGTPSSDGWVYLWQGMRQVTIGSGSTATPLYESMTRFYNPGLGTWVAPDALGYADGMNLYQFERGNPESSLDPFGTLTAQEYAIQTVEAEIVALEGDPALEDVDTGLLLFLNQCLKALGQNDIKYDTDPTAQGWTEKNWLSPGSTTGLTPGSDAFTILHEMVHAWQEEYHPSSTITEKEGEAHAAQFLLELLDHLHKGLYSPDLTCANAQKMWTAIFSGAYLFKPKVVIVNGKAVRGIDKSDLDYLKQDLNLSINYFDLKMMWQNYLRQHNHYCHPCILTLPAILQAQVDKLLQ